MYKKEVHVTPESSVKAGESALQLYDRLKPYIDKRRVDKKSYAENYSWLIEKIEQMKDVSPI